jgi:acyl-CoA thioester hydrolase
MTPHRYAVRVYFEDTDAGGVVYHASYLRFAERARTEALRDAGAPHAELRDQHGLIFVVRRIKMDYLRPATLDQLITVETVPLELRGAAVTLRQRFHHGTTLLGEIEVVLVCIDQAGLRPVRIPARWRDVLMPDAGSAMADKGVGGGSDG